jgi:hypothetical protein
MGIERFAVLAAEAESYINISEIPMFGESAERMTQ